MVTQQIEIKLLIRAACILFLYNNVTTALRGASPPSCRTIFHSLQHGKALSNNYAFFRNRNLLVHTAFVAKETFGEDILSDKAASSPSIDQIALVLSDFHVITRVDAVEKINHVELYLRRRKGGNFQCRTMIPWHWYRLFLCHSIIVASLSKWNLSFNDEILTNLEFYWRPLQGSGGLVWFSFFPYFWGQSPPRRLAFAPIHHQA